MIPLVLVAASGLAREVAAMVGLVPEHHVVAYVDDDPALAGTEIDGVPVVGGIDALADTHLEADVLICAGRGRSRQAIVDRLTRLGVSPDRYATVVHPTASVPQGCTLGAGTILLAQVVLTAQVTIGRHVVAMPQVTLTHDDVVGDFATLCAGVSLGGSVDVGERAYLGMNASVRENLTVGRDSTLGMGSALTRHLPDEQIWAGIPARPISSKSQERT
ncbi:acetyltransferase [Nocardioides sp. GY 10113]|uniref:NeuD/PglB/VioB family sugar acetyltransferase n=1 Tax=Nocardioides sp. GY 10113 TaxID=2569761 RepID=UPI0010A90EE5|nr:NeuD/PglB/VioB family sugar acetyltransferase [Nocardioides sp. GY 10113]TIC79537.1 acetyltransferase [Nocardioides sp. GY 10113]